MRSLRGAAGIRIEPWAVGDLPPLQKCLGDPAMMEHLGGPESAEKIAERQNRYEQPDSGQFKIVDEAMRAFQARGIAAAGAREVISLARSLRACRFMHAYPSIDNGPSNAICRRLGFTLQGPCGLEYPSK